MTSSRKRKIQIKTLRSGGGGPSSSRPRPSKEQKNKLAAKPPAAPAPPPRRSRQKQQQAPVEKPTIPFGPDDRILLIGEGDLSFAASIAKHHGCTKVTATVLEKDLAELQAKYPHVDANVADIHEAADSNKIVYGVDATKLPNSVSRPPHDRILFNFPHVGGKSTDVNRQVRYNQELLVNFFQRALPALSPGGSIVVTLFEGEPYTLWNIRDLGRHAGLQVERSFAFQASAYPGYHHARTLGVVKNKNGDATGGGWRGEERASRSYIFRRKGEVPPQPVSKKKRKADDDSSSDEDND